MAAAAAAKHHPDAHGAAAFSREESSRVAANTREYLQMDVKNLRHIKPASCFQQRLPTIYLWLNSIFPSYSENILKLVDITEQQASENSDWVDGWGTPFHKALHRSDSRRLPDVAAFLMQIINKFFATLEKD